MRLTVFLSALVFLLTCGLSRAGGTLQIIIEPVFNGQPVKPGLQYITANGDSLYIDLFRFYISGVCISADGRPVPEDSSFHLVDMEQEPSLTITWKNVPARRYEALTFNLGIDSITNMSGAMGGDLDPTKAMYWAWNTGYINAKLEGHSNVCKTLHHAFEFHIGGFHAPYNTLRKVSVPLENIAVTDNAVTVIHLEADVAAWFNGVQLKTENSITDPGNAAMKMADNYAHMFTIQSPERR